MSIVHKKNKFFDFMTLHFLYFETIYKRFFYIFYTNYKYTNNDKLTIV